MKKDEKILYHVTILGSFVEYYILAKNKKEAVKIALTEVNSIYPANPPHTLPYNKNDVQCLNLDKLKHDMIKEKREIEA